MTAWALALLTEAAVWTALAAIVAAFSAWLYGAP